MWISDKDSENYYHIWDNRVMPSFVTEKDGPIADVIFRSKYRTYDVILITIGHVSPP